MSIRSVKKCGEEMPTSNCTEISICVRYCKDPFTLTKWELISTIFNFSIL